MNHPTLTRMEEEEEESPVSAAARQLIRQRAARRATTRPFLPPLRRVELPPVAGPGPLMQVAVFAGIHGDEPAGTLAVQELAAWARRKPAVLAACGLHLFPVCNPTGLRAGTRHSGNGMDLNREFWTGSDQPEVRMLEFALRATAYDVIISLHEDDTSHGLYGFAGDDTVAQHVLEPALAAASVVLPRNLDAMIDGFPAHQGIITGGYPGMLGAPPEQRPRPLEIVFETPALAPRARRVVAALLAVQEILAAARRLRAFSPDL